MTTEKQIVEVSNAAESIIKKLSEIEFRRKLIPPGVSKRSKGTLLLVLAWAEDACQLHTEFDRLHSEIDPKAFTDPVARYGTKLHRTPPGPFGTSQQWATGAARIILSNLFYAFVGDQIEDNPIAAVSPAVLSQPLDAETWQRFAATIYRDPPNVAATVLRRWETPLIVPDWTLAELASDISSERGAALRWASEGTGEGKQVDDATTGTKKGNGKASGTKRGPTATRDAEADRQLWEDWQRAKATGTTRAEFAKDRGITIADIENARRNAGR